MTDSIHGNLYNPDWLTDDALIANFIVRKEEFLFLQEELRGSPLTGTVQHYVLVGLRGSGKTTLLKRIAIAIRRESFLSDHLIALSFPEELYQVKALSDFWLAACESLADELYYLGLLVESESLFVDISNLKRNLDRADHMSDAGFKLMQRYCEKINRRAVLLVDNLDMVFSRIDKTRKNSDPLSPAYWAMRESLSTSTSPIVIGGSVRLSEPFTNYDKAFYDFFIPKRLGRLTLDEVRLVLNQLADRQGEVNLKDRINKKSSRLEALYDLTGGNPRAIGLIFELLRVGPNSRAVEDFHRLMDITTPYYKARFEDLPEQAQVVMHALAVRKQDSDTKLRFGHTAAELADYVGLPTNTVSAQLVSLENEGLVEKIKSLGRAQYRMSEQLFRLWLQMRGSRRIRENVIGLTDFLEVMYDAEELQVGISTPRGAGHLAEAQFAFAAASIQSTAVLKKSLEAHAADRVFKILETKGGDINDYLPDGDLSTDLESVTRLRELLRKCSGGGLSLTSQEALLGSLKLTADEIKEAIECLSGEKKKPYDLSTIEKILSAERVQLLERGLREEDLQLLYSKRATGLLPLPKLTPEEVEGAELMEKRKPSLRRMIWRLLGACSYISLEELDKAKSWLLWGETFLADADANEWARVAGAFRLAEFPDLSRKALSHAENKGSGGRLLYEKGIEKKRQKDYSGAEALFRSSIELDPNDPIPWIQLARNLARDQKKLEEANSVYEDLISIFPNNLTALIEFASLLGWELDKPQKAIEILKRVVELDSSHFSAWHLQAVFYAISLDDIFSAYEPIKKALSIDPDNIEALRSYAYILAQDDSALEEALAVHRRLTELDPERGFSWRSYGTLLLERAGNYMEAAECFRRAVAIDDQDLSSLNTLARILIDYLDSPIEAEGFLRRVIEIDPTNDVALNNLGMVLADNPAKFEEAESAFRASVENDPDGWEGWSNLGLHLTSGGKFEDAELALRKALSLKVSDPSNWLNLGNLLAEVAEDLEQRSSLILNDADAVEVLNNQASGYWSEAERAFRRAAELDKSNGEALLNLGISFRKRGKDSEAESAFRAALERDPNDARALSTLGNLLAYKSDSFVESEETLKRSLEIDPESPNAWNSLGILMVQMGRYDEAADAYVKCTQKFPAFAPAWINYGHLLTINLDLTDEAIEVYKKAVELDPSESSVWNNLGIMFSRKPEKAAEAEEAYRKAIWIDPHLALPWHNLYRFFTYRGRDEEASTLLSESEGYRDIDDENWHVFYVDVKVFEAMPHLESAIAEEDIPALGVALRELFNEPGLLKYIAVNKSFVEVFLAGVLETKVLATVVYDFLGSIGFDREARPLLLAFEAAITSRPESIDILEPEVRTATSLMYQRLMGAD